ASARRSDSSMRSAMRSKVSNAERSERPAMVSWIRFWACARFCLAMRRFFLRLASSILSFSSRSAPLSFSVSIAWRCQVSSREAARSAYSCCRSSAWRARSSRPSRTASTARCSHSAACFRSSSTCALSLRSSAIATATSCLARASCSRMSTITWLRTFSGFSPREIASLMLERMSRDRRCRMPMALALMCDRDELGEPREMGRSSENETLERVAQLREVERLHVERVREDQVGPLDAVAAVHDVRRVELEETAVEPGVADVVGIRWQVHDLEAEDGDGGRVVDDDGRGAVLRAERPHSVGHFLGLCAEADQIALEVLSRHHTFPPGTAR